MKVNVSATFKRSESELNGLSVIADRLLDRARSHETYVVVAIVRPHANKWLAEDDEEQPTVKFVQIEALDGAAAIAARDLLVDAYRLRTGRGGQPTLFDSDTDSDRDDDDGDEAPDDPDTIGDVPHRGADDEWADELSEWNGKSGAVPVPGDTDSTQTSPEQPALTIA